MIGLMLWTFHMSAMPCDDTYGVYFRSPKYIAGVFNNSECNTGAYAGWAPETNTLTLGPVQAKAGVVIGGIIGYEKYPVLPLILPSAAVSFHNKVWYRATFLPKVGTSAGGVMLSVESSFK